MDKSMTNALISGSMMFRIKVKIENRRDESEWFGVICFKNFVKARLTLSGVCSVTTWFLSINFGKLVALTCQLNIHIFKPNAFVFERII